MPRNRGARERVATGIYRDAVGFSIVATVAGTQHERRVAAGTSLSKLLEAREDLRSELRRRAKRAGLNAPAAGTLAKAAPTYLASVRQMPSYRTRRWHIELWVETLGKMHRDDITPAMVSAQLHAWLGEGRSPQTCNHLRTALVQLYVRLDGKEARNPARAVPKFRTEAPIARAIPVLDLARVLHHVRQGSKTRARLAVIATTGLAHAELMRLTRADIDLVGGSLLARARRKGAGSQPRRIPLTHHARLALQLFMRRDAWGVFSTASMRSRFRDACEQAGFGHTDWRPYDLRHTFATQVAAAGDERAVQAVLGHTTTTTTRRYTLGSVDDRVARAVLGMDRRGHDRGPGLPATKGNKPQQTTSKRRPLK